MDLSNDEVLSSVHGLYVPQVLVLTSAGADKTCYKNQLEFIDLIRPYETVCKTIYTSLSMEMGTIVVRNFQVKFQKVEDFLPLPEDSFHDYLRSVFQKNYNHDVNKNLMFQVRKGKKLNRAINYTPWFDRFRGEVLRHTVRTTKYEVFKHPVVLLLVASTSDSNPIKTYDTMFSEKNPPQWIKNNRVNSNMFRFYILLHDEESGMKEQKIRSMYGKVQKISKNQCRLLRINSRLKDQRMKRIQIPKVKPIPEWTKHPYDQFLLSRKKVNLFSEFENKGAGFFLSDQDLISIRNCVEDFIKDGLVKWMRAWTDSVFKKKRKGGKLEKLWKSLFKGNKPMGPMGFDSIEYQTRKLADFCFMLQCYKNSLENYSDIRGVFKKRGLGYKANMNEMIALSRYFVEVSDNSGSILDGGAGASTTLISVQTFGSIAGQMREAVELYLEDRQLYMAMRTCLLLYTFYKIQLQFINAAELLIRFNKVLSDKPHVQAIFYEQAGLCYLMDCLRGKVTTEVSGTHAGGDGSLSGHRRKFSFLMNLAGNRYFLSQYYHHAIRSWMSCYGVYYEKSWLKIFETYTIWLARTTDKLEKDRSSLCYFHDHFSLLVTQKPKEQMLYMQRFIHLAKQFLDNFNSQKDGKGKKKEEDNKQEGMLLNFGNDEKKKKEAEDEKKLFEVKKRIDEEVFDLSLPEFDLSETTLRIEISNDINYTIKEEKWNVLRKKLLDSKEEFWMNEKLKSCVVCGETVSITICIKNRLSIPINVSQIRLIGKLKLDDGTEKDIPLQQIKEEEYLDQQKSSNGERFKSRTLSFQLQPLEKKMVNLDITPIKTGTLHVTGMFWEIEKLFSGRKDFNLIGRRLNKTKDQRRTKAYEENKKLHFRILPKEVPRIRCEFQKMPENLSAGEVKKTWLVLHNIGLSSIHDISIVSNKPSFCVIGGRRKVTDQKKKKRSDDLLMFDNNADNKEEGGENEDEDELDEEVLKFAQPEKIDDVTWIKKGKIFGREVIGVEELLPKIEDDEKKSQGEGALLIFDDAGGSEAKDIEFRPGEILRFPVYFRGTKLVESGTAHRLKFLIYYSPSNGDLRKTVPFVFEPIEKTLRVNQFLGVTPFLQPSLRDNQSFVMGLKYTNKTTNEIIKLERVVSLSSKWTMRRKVLNTTSESARQEAFNCYVNPRESIIFYYMVSERKTKSKEEDVMYHTSIDLNPDISKSKKGNSIAMAHNTFFFKEIFVNQPEVVVDKGPVVPRGRFDKIEEKTPEEIEMERVEKKTKKREKEGMFSLMTFWSSGTQKGKHAQKFGQLNCIDIIFSHLARKRQMIHPLNDSFATQHNPCPLQIILRYPKHVEYDFSSEGRECCCFVPVVFEIENISLNCQVSFSVHLFGNKKMFKEAYSWVGSTKIHFQRIDPQKSIRVPVRVCFYKNGTYNLNQFRCLWRIYGRHNMRGKGESKDREIGFSKVQYLIHIRDPKKTK